MYKTEDFVADTLIRLQVLCDTKNVDFEKIVNSFNFSANHKKLRE